VDGRSTRFTSGETIAIAALGEAAHGLAAGWSADDVRDAAISSADDRSAAARGGLAPRPAAPLRDEMTELEGTFVAALSAGDHRAAVGALLDLDGAISARVRAGEDSPDLDNASATFRSLIVRLGDRAGAGSSDGISREQLEPLVGALLAARDQARAARDWATADVIRNQLAAAGIEVRDSAEGSSWVIAGDDD
jgi:cysteinyl-tRNA synthetase